MRSKWEKFSVCIVVLTILSMLISSCSKSSAPESAKPPEEKTRITIVTATPGGAQEVTGAAVAEIWKKAISGIEFSSVPSGGTAVNPDLLRQGDGDVGFLTGAASSAAINGEPPYTTTYPELRSMFGFYPNTLQMWSRTDAGINDFGDIKNKRFSMGNPSSGGYQPGLNLMQTYGFNPEDMQQAGGELIPLAWNEAVEALQDGNLDAIMWSTNFPAAGIVNAQTGNDRIFLVQSDPAKLREYINTYPGWVEVNIPAGTYKGQANDVITVGTQSMLAVTDKMPEDLVYQMTKTLWEARDQLGLVHVLLKDISSETVARGLVAPLHPGAKRFYQEMGFPTDE